MGDKIIIIVGVIIGLTLGFGGGFLTKTVMTQIELANLRSERDQAVLARQTMQKQWEAAVNELNATKVVLNDTLAALELLKKYSAVDEKTRKDVQDLKKTLDPQGQPTPETEDLFRKLVDKFNQLNGITASFTDTTTILDLTPFKQLREEAEKLYKETQELVFSLGLGA